MKKSLRDDRKLHPSVLIRRASILLLPFMALFLIACGRHRLQPDELERNQFFAEILEHQDRRDLGGDDFFPKNLLHNRHPEVRRWCAMALGRIGSRKALPWLYESLRTGDAAVRSASAFAIGEIEDRELLREQFLQPRPQSLAELAHALNDASISVRMRAVEALGKIGARAAGPNASLSESDLSPGIHPATGGNEASDPKELGQRFFDVHDAVAARAAAAAYGTVADRKKPWAPIIQTYYRISASNDAVTKVALLRQLEPYLREAEAQSALLAALHDGERNPRLTAAGLLRQSGNSDIPEDPGPERPTASSLTYLMVTASRRDRTTAVLETTRGTIEIELFREDAPMAVSNFVSLAKQGFYDGTSFMRSIPFSMVEGGDHPDGREKRPGYSIRCEINLRPFERGSLGMANVGKDTGAARFFITLAPQPQLDGKFTCFGRVTSGMQAVERMAPGDRIRRIEIREDVTLLDYRRF